MDTDFMHSVALFLESCYGDDLGNCVLFSRTGSDAEQRKYWLADVQSSLADAQFQIARLYGFASWPKLKAHVDSLEEVGQLKQAIDSNDFARVKALMTRNPALHRAPLGYGKDGHSLTMLDCANGHQKEAVDEREENCQREGEADEEARPHGKNS